MPARIQRNPVSDYGGRSWVASVMFAGTEVVVDGTGRENTVTAKKLAERRPTPERKATLRLTGTGCK